MNSGFIGRAAELALLGKRLDRVTSSGSGAALAIRGRRQVGKSRLVQEFCDQSAAPYFFFAATKGASPVETVQAFCAGLKESSLAAAPDLIPVLDTGSWPDAFRILAAALPARPAIVVLDELPWLAEQDDLFDGALQTAWDRLLSNHPVVLILLGSDLHMMERLTAYDHPFFGRADNLVLGPLNLAETADAAGLTGSGAIDAHLVSGGLPGVLRTWPYGTPALSFIQRECADPAASLFSVPEAALLAEFPRPDQARRVLEAVGSGDRTQANIAASAGGRQGAMPSGSLSPLLRTLVVEKRVLAMDEPLSIRPGKPSLYRVSDSNLRLYLAALREAHELARRGRPEAAFGLVERRWTAWRGRAVEPLIRESLQVAASSGDLQWPGVQAVGGWWNRQFNPEIDLVGADRAPVARRILFAGSIKWLGTPFDRHDLAALAAGVAEIPGFAVGQTGLVIVTRSGSVADLDLAHVDLVWSPDDVVRAWRAESPSP
jgi:AAA+ ATPase superfamily predicted ATPase